MEGESHHSLTSMPSVRSEIDTSRPFRSVKEAVAIFGERILLSTKPYSQIANIPNPNRSPPPPNPQFSPPSPSYSTSSSRFAQERDEEELQTILRSMKKLEEEVEHTKREIAVLKNNGSRTEIAVASLNADLYKNRAKIAEMEASAGGLAEGRRDLRAGSGCWEEEEIVAEGKKEEYLPSLGEALKIAQADVEGDGRRRGAKVVMKKKMKKKPIVPLIGDLFSGKKGGSVYSKAFFGVMS